MRIRSYFNAILRLINNNNNNNYYYYFIIIIIIVIIIIIIIRKMNRYFHKFREEKTSLQLR